jgi:HEAT repeat protein
MSLFAPEQAGRRSIMSIRAASSLLIPSLLIVSLGCGGDPTTRLIDELRNPDVAIRRSAARVIAQQPKPDDRFIAPLTKSVTDDDVEVRRMSAVALGRFGPVAKSSEPALKKALTDPEQSVRLKAALALQHVDPKDTSFSPVLITAMHTGDGRTLLEIGEMGKDGAWAVPTLIDLLSHDSAKVRALAAQTLGQIGPSATEAKAALQSTAHDPNPAVQTTARDALKKIQGQAMAAGRP